MRLNNIMCDRSQRYGDNAIDRTFCAIFLHEFLAVCVTPVLVRSLKAHLSTASNWIGVQTGVHGFDSRTPHKPVVSKTSEADIWLSSYDHLTDVGGQRGGCQQLSQRKGACFLLNKKEALSGLIQVNDDEERNGGQAGRVYGCQL